MFNKMKNWHKRGIEKGTLVLLILALLIMIWYFGFQKSTKAYADQSLAVTACKASVDRNARLHIRGIEFPAKVDCPAQSITVNDADSTFQQKEKIARSMYDCWWEFGQGKLNLFSDEGVYCNVCAYVDVKTKDSITGLPDFLLNQQSPDKNGLTYSDYLTSYNTQNAQKIVGEIKTQELVESQYEGKLPGNNLYAVLFVYAKGEDGRKRLKDHFTLNTNIEGQLGLTFGILGGAAVGTGLAGTSALVGMATLGAVTGPPGWAIIGTAVVVGASVGFISSFFATDKNYEWSAFTVLRQWNKGTDTLLNNFGCNILPSEIE